MSAKFLGIGLLSIGGLVVGAAGGYLAMKTDVPAPTEVAAAPVTTPTVTAPAPDPEPKPAEAPAAAMPVSQTPSRPAPKPQGRTMVNGSGKPIRTDAPVQPKVAESPVTAATPTPIPAVTPAPVSDPPVATPTPAATEVPRYVPDTPAATVAPDPQRIDFEELTVAKHSVIGIRLDAPVSTRTARVEDRVSATVSRDVTVAGRTAIAAGVRLEGTVVLVERGGRFKNRPRLGLQFDRMILADGTRVNLKTDTIFREGDSPSADATAKVGTGAVAGAILGAMIGGKKGAVIGTAAGAAGGVATVMRGDAGEASLAGGAPLTVRLTEDVAVRINR